MSIHPSQYKTDGDYIERRLIDEFLAHRRAKAADYEAAGFENHRVLGIRGQFSDIWRKIAKLKAALWDGMVLKGEQPREILLDLIGHCFLTIACMDRQDAIAIKSETQVLPTIPPGERRDARI